MVVVSGGSEDVVGATVVVGADVVVVTTSEPSGEHAVATSTATIALVMRRCGIRIGGQSTGASA